MGGQGNRRVVFGRKRSGSMSEGLPREAQGLSALPAGGKARSLAGLPPSNWIPPNGSQEKLPRTRNLRVVPLRQPFPINASGQTKRSGLSGPEAFDALALILEDIEDGGEFGNLKKIVNFLRQIQQFELPTLA